jgi:hypothetical protein
VAKLKFPSLAAGLLLLRLLLLAIMMMRHCHSSLYEQQAQHSTLHIQQSTINIQNSNQERRRIPTVSINQLIQIESNQT